MNKEAIITELIDYKVDHDLEISNETLDILINMLKYQELTSVVEEFGNQKTGHWENIQLIPNNMTGHAYGECSVCGKLRIISNYCTNCGAKMDIE